MGGKSSKTKGSTGERELCKILSECFGASFTRTPGSGSFVGGKNGFRKSTLSAGQLTGLRGDIVPPDHMPKLLIEAKSYGDFRFHQLLQAGGCALLDRWIDQAKSGAGPLDEWLVIFKISRVGWFICARAHPDYRFDDFFAAYRGHRIGALDSFLMVNREAVLRRSR